VVGQRQCLSQHFRDIISVMPDASREHELDNVLVSVWRQTLVDRAKSILLGDERYSVRRTTKRGLAQVDFEFARQSIRGLEQNPQTTSRWAELARKGSRIMQFLSAGRYIAVVCDGKVTHYGGRNKVASQESGR
jgi:hypothetical protein